MKKGSVNLIAITAIVIILIIGGIFFAIRYFDKSASNQNSITPKNNSSTQLPQGNSDATLGRSVTSIDSDLNQLDSDNVSSDQGLGDQQIDVNQ